MENHLLTNIGVYGVVIENQKILFLHLPGNNLWTLPGGRVNDNDKSIEIALQREIQEELGLNSEVYRPITNLFFGWPKEKRRLGIFYECSIEGKEIKLSSEHDDYKYFSYKEAKEMLSQDERGKVGLELLKELKKLNLIK